MGKRREKRGGDALLGGGGKAQYSEELGTKLGKLEVGTARIVRLGLSEKRRKEVAISQEKKYQQFKKQRG